MRRLKRFALPLVLSTALHLGAGFGISKIVQQMRQPKPVRQQVLHEEIKPEPAPKKKPDLNKLLKEREQYVSEIHSALMRGEEVKLSDFLIKSAVLDRNIEMAEKGEFGPTEEHIRQKYDALVAKVKEEAELYSDKPSTIHYFLHTKILKGYFYASDSIIDILERGWYNCLSSTQLYSALLEDVAGIKNYKIMLYDDHLATFLKGRKIENVEHLWKKTNKRYNGCGFPVHRDAFIAAYLVKNGIEPGELPADISRIYSIKKRWKGCPKKGKKIVENIVAESGFPDPGVKSGISVPSYFMENPYYLANTEDIVKLAEGLYAAYEFAHLHEEDRFTEVEVNGNKMLINAIIIPEKVDWGQLLELFKSYFAFHSMMKFFPLCYECCGSLHTIAPEIIPEIIDEIPELAEKFREYQTDEICNRYSNAIEWGNMAEVDSYTDFHFCTEVDEPLKDRYRQEKDKNILRHGLGKMEIADNFDFFLNELDVLDDSEMKEAAVAGMMYSDTEKACNLLDELSEERKKPIQYQIMLGCWSDEIAWRYVYEWNEGKRKFDAQTYVAFEIIEGKNITETEYEFLKTTYVKAPPPLKFQIARIVYEYGDKETGLKYIDEAVDTVVRSDMYDQAICLFPREFAERLVPLLDKEDHEISIAEGIMCHGEEGKYMEDIVRALRRVVNNENKHIITRIHAAFILLRLGVEPLEE